MAQTKDTASQPEGTPSPEPTQPSQENAGLLIDKLAFSRLVREIINTHKEDFRIEHSTLLALQEVAEDFLIGYFEDCLVNAASARRVTIQIEDSRLARQYYGKLFGGEFDVSETLQVDGPDAKDD